MRSISRADPCETPDLDGKTPDLDGMSEYSKSQCSPMPEYPTEVEFLPGFDDLEGLVDMQAHRGKLIEESKVPFVHDSLPDNVRLAPELQKQLGIHNRVVRCLSRQTQTLTRALQIYDRLSCQSTPSVEARYSALVWGEAAALSAGPPQQTHTRTPPPHPSLPEAALGASVPRRPSPPTPGSRALGRNGRPLVAQRGALLELTPRPAAGACASGGGPPLAEGGFVEVQHSVSRPPTAPTPTGVALPLTQDPSLFDRSVSFREVLRETNNGLHGGTLFWECDSRTVARRAVDPFPPWGGAGTCAATAALLESSSLCTSSKPRLRNSARFRSRG